MSKLCPPGRHTQLGVRMGSPMRALPICVSQYSCPDPCPRNLRPNKSTFCSINPSFPNCNN